MNITGEINCFGLCVRLSDLAPLVGLLMVISITLLAASQMIRKPKQRLLTFVSAQVSVLLAIAATFYLMKCSYMLSFYLYAAYAIISTVIIFGVLRYYDRIMIRRLDARPAGNIINWTQEFVDRLTSATVYYFDSAVPRAFASGRSIFVSLGLLELLNDEELRAVKTLRFWELLEKRENPAVGSAIRAVLTSLCNESLVDYTNHKK